MNTTYRPAPANPFWLVAFAVLASIFLALTIARPARS